MPKDEFIGQETPAVENEFPRQKTPTTESGSPRRELSMSERESNCANSNETNPFGIEEDVFERWQELQKDSQHPERYVLGKPHPDRARQFKPFAALRGYEELVEREVARANETHDFTKLEESI